MRLLVILTALIMLLSGCSVSFEATSLVEEIPSSARDERQAVILSQKNEGIYDEHSVFAYPVFLGTEEDYTSPYLAKSYRSIQPWKGERDVFKTLSERLNSTIEDTSLGDILVPYLLTEEAVNLSDEDLLERLSTITEAYIFSKISDSTHYRLIALNEEPNREYSHWMSWHYFIQVWDDDYIWAQPLHEGIQFEFNQAAFVTAPDKSQLLLLSGRTDRPSGSSFAVAGTGFMFEDGIWIPIKWETIYNEVVELENLEVGSDGIRMIYTDSYMAQSYNLPLHTGGIYELKLAEDGSFWADYSKFPNDSANENLPSEELLFKIKQ